MSKKTGDSVPSESDYESSDDGNYWQGNGHGNQDWSTSGGGFGAMEVYTDEDGEPVPINESSTEADMTVTESEGEDDDQNLILQVRDDNLLPSSYTTKKRRTSSHIAFLPRLYV